MSLEEINNTIEALKESSTTFANCEKLASLYMCREYLTKPERNDTEKELSDILPQYKEYCKIKKKYQLNEITKSSVIDSVEIVCKEITEFIQILYHNTDMEEERDRIHSMLQSLQQM